MATNIPAQKTGNLSVVHEKIPIGDNHSYPTSGLINIPFAKNVNKTIEAKIIGSFFNEMKNMGDNAYNMMIVGMNHKSRLNNDNIPMFNPSFKTATDDPNNKKTIYFRDPQRKQLGISLLNLREKYTFILLLFSEFTSPIPERKRKTSTPQ